jgi:hypothetical protein
VVLTACHADFSMQTMKADICLVRLDEPFNTTNFVKLNKNVDFPAPDVCMEWKEFTKRALCMRHRLLSDWIVD